MKKIYTLIAALAITFAGYAQNNALNFDGTNDYVSTNFIFNNSLFANWTLECWVKSPAAPSGTGYSGPIYGDNMGIVWNHVSAAYSGVINIRASNGNYYAVSFGAITPNTWYHTAAAYNGTVLNVYKNGISEASYNVPSGGMSNGVSPLRIGRHPTVANYFKGTIDEVRIWNVARACGDINTYMNVELIGNELGLQGYYNFNEGVATLQMLPLQVLMIYRQITMMVLYLILD